MSSRFVPEGLDEARLLWWEFFGRAGGMILEPMLSGHESELSPILREFEGWTAAAPAHTGDSMLAAWLGRDAVREKILVQMRKYPVIICPVAAIPAFHHGEREWQVEGTNGEISRRLELLRVVQPARASRPQSFRWVILNRACRLACRSSAGPGKKNSCWRLLR